MLVGYLENLNSDRRIISTSRMRMDILYFIGYDLDEELPWHSTLSRTRQLYGEQEFTAIFKQVLKKCIDKGMVSGKRQAIDSVFVKANAAMSSLVEREIMDDATAYSKELVSNQQQESTEGILGLKTESKLASATPNKKTKKLNQALLSPSDPDARMSYKNGKLTRLNYLLDKDKRNEKKYANAAVYHDIGIWTDQTIDYLDPSVAQANKYLSEIGKAEWIEEMNPFPMFKK